jgi:aspartyl-tRNA(Asn)/glutamyl-tRNA(Gln) amidotransferase subunit A
MIGTYVLSHGYYDAYYLQAQKIRRMIADDFQQAFKLRRDCRPGGAHGGLEARRPWQRPAGRLPGRHLHPAGSLAGLPGMSVPAGFGAGGMPVGMQLIGNYFQESRLLNVAHRFQQATDWHTPQARGLLRP